IISLPRAPSRDSFTSSDFISYATTLTPRNCCLTDKSGQSRRAPRVWRQVGATTSGALRSKCACAPSPLGRDSSRGVCF
ncbi:hypothetical protein DBR06_SOUSAS1010136, partial [Sousa chinensis]